MIAFYVLGTFQSVLCVLTLLIFRPPIIIRILPIGRHRELRSQIKVTQQNPSALCILNFLERSEYKYFSTILTMETFFSSNGEFQIIALIGISVGMLQNKLKEKNKTLFPILPHQKYYLYHGAFVLRCYNITLTGWGIQMVNRQALWNRSLSLAFQHTQ